MRTRWNLQESSDAQNHWQMDEVDGANDEWFTASTQQLRERTAQEGAFINRPSRETVERIIDWFQDENSQVRH